MNLDYIIRSALLLTVLYGAFALLLSRETFHRFNRLALLSVLVASLVLPAVRLSIDKSRFMAVTEACQLSLLESASQPLTDDPSPSASSDASSLSSEFHSDPAAAVSPPQGSRRGVWAALYLLGLLTSLALFLCQLLAIRRDLRGSIRVPGEGGSTVIVRGGDFPPYSFLHYIIISARDYEHLRRPILAHEQAHIRLGHTYDLLLLELVKALQWFNPFVYLLARDLKAVHEYEADDAVLHLGIDAKTYQLLLVTKAVGGRLQTVCNNLSHHSLKKRIQMMHKNKSHRWQMAKAAFLPALMAVALIGWAKAPSDPTAPLYGGENFAEGTIEEVDVTEKDANPKMLRAYIMTEDMKKNPRWKDHSDKIIVTWLRGTWVVTDDDEFVEEHPVCKYPWMLSTGIFTITLDGKKLDVHNLPDLPASALKKIELSSKNHTANLVTSPVTVPASVKGNINPELTILLTGTPPKDCGTKTSIWFRGGLYDGFSWKNYTITSWKWKVEDIGQHLEEVAIRRDHNVRVNVCTGVPQEHIDRLTRMMKEKGVTNYKFVRQQ